MTDIRIVSKADLNGIWADWLLIPAIPSKTDLVEWRAHAWFYFGTDYFGSRFFGAKYFAPPWTRRRVPVLARAAKLDESRDLETAVKVALLTDRLASEDEVLPDPDSTDRRGWWGDMDAESIWDGWPIGCKNWLLTRAKITGINAREGSTLERARQYTLSALQPLVDRSIASRVEATAKRVELDRIEVSATIYRGPGMDIDLRWQSLWEDVGEPPLEEFRSA